MPIDVDRGYVPNLRDHDGNIVVGQPNAGVLSRFTYEGIAVHMYWGNPGHYFGDHGQELPESMGKAAGFDVDSLGRERKKREAMSTALSAIESEYTATNTRDVVLERDNYRMIHIGSDRFNIEFEDNTVMNPAPLARDVAMRVFDQLAPPPKPEPKQSKALVVKDDG